MSWKTSEKKVQENDAEIAKLKSAMVHAEMEYRELHTQHVSALNDVSAKQEALEKYKIEIEAFTKNKLPEYQGLEQKNLGLQSNAAALIDQVTTLNSQVTYLKEQLTNTETKLSIATESVNNLESEKTKLGLVFSKAMENIEFEGSLDVYISKSSETLLEYNATIQSLNEAATKRVAVIEKLESEMRELKEAAKGCTTVKEMLQNEVKKLTEAAKNHVSLNEKLQGEVKKLTGANKDHTTIKEKLQGEVTGRSGEIDGSCQGPHHSQRKASNGDQRTEATVARSHYSCSYQGQSDIPSIKQRISSFKGARTGDPQQNIKRGCPDDQH